MIGLELDGLVCSGGGPHCVEGRHPLCFRSREPAVRPWRRRAFDMGRREDSVRQPQGGRRLPRRLHLQVLCFQGAKGKRQALSPSLSHTLSFLLLRSQRGDSPSSVANAVSHRGLRFFCGVNCGELRSTSIVVLRYVLLLLLQSRDNAALQEEGSGGKMATKLSFEVSLASLAQRPTNGFLPCFNLQVVAFVGPLRETL